VAEVHLAQAIIDFDWQIVVPGYLLGGHPRSLQRAGDYGIQRDSSHVLTDLPCLGEPKVIQRYIGKADQLPETVALGLAVANQVEMR
jgi:hypothetical protein